ncbi:MAG: glycine cleavage system H protein [Rhodospirillaceae bacterium]|nr:MAG: glycine cleavage system H protein [Rhodospirillaceae bacterium]
MAQIRFTGAHEWIRQEGAEGTVGITDYAQKQLGDMVFVELPEVGRKAEKGAEVAVVESVKAASEVYAPAAGEVVAVNDALSRNPALINEDPLGDGWILRLRLTTPEEMEALMDSVAYEAYVAGLV